MTDHGSRFDHRVPDKVLSHPDRRSLAVGHLQDVSEGGLSLHLPLCLLPGSRIHVKLTRMTDGVLRHFEFAAASYMWKLPAQGTHGIKFGELTAAQRTALTDSLVPSRTAISDGVVTGRVSRDRLARAPVRFNQEGSPVNDLSPRATSAQRR